MAFSITCSDCSRRYLDIDEAFLGKRARCDCGTVVSLDPRRNKTTGQAATPAQHSVTSPSNQSHDSAASNGSAIQRPIQQQKQPVTDRRQSSSNSKSKSKTIQRRQSSPTTDRQPATAPNPRNPTVVSTPATSPPPAANSPATNSSPAADLSPAGFDNFDIDDILAGGADTSPLMAAAPTTPSPVEAPASTSVSKPSPIGVYGSIVAAISGGLATLMIFSTRLFSFAGTPLGWMGAALYGSQTASLGSGEMTDFNANLFLGIGWVLLLLAIVMGLAILFLLLRVGTRISTGKKIMPWSRAMLAIVAVICLFVLVGLTIVQSIHHHELITGLNEFYDQSLEGLIPDDADSEPFKEIRQQYALEKHDFLIGLISFAMLPLLAFLGAVFSLFFDER